MTVDWPCFKREQNIWPKSHWSIFSFCENPLLDNLFLEFLPESGSGVSDHLCEELQVLYWALAKPRRCHQALAMCWMGLETLPCFRAGLGPCSHLCPSCRLFLSRAATQEQSLFCGEPCAPAPPQHYEAGTPMWMVLPVGCRGAVTLDCHLNSLGPWHLITAIPNFSVMALIQSAVPRMCK